MDMARVASLIQQLEAAGEKVEFSGPQSAASISQLEEALAVSLPRSYREFLCNFGAGGVVGEPISGIYKNQPLMPNPTTAYGDTTRGRERFQMPKSLAAVFSQDDEVLWALDLSRCDAEGECPVVDYDLHFRRIGSVLFPSFESFFLDYLEQHLGLV